LPIGKSKEKSGDEYDGNREQKGDRENPNNGVGYGFGHLFQIIGLKNIGQQKIDDHTNSNNGDLIEQRVFVLVIDGP
jgi:hypothetical protein